MSPINRTPNSSPEPTETKLKENKVDNSTNNSEVDPPEQRRESSPPLKQSLPHTEPIEDQVNNKGVPAQSKDVSPVNKDTSTRSVHAKEPPRNPFVVPKIKTMYNKTHLPTDIREDEYYYEWAEEILEGFPNKGPPYTPGRLSHHVYIGSLINAEDENLLKRIGITHVLNCAGTRRFDLEKSPYPKDVGVKEYRMIPAEDFEDYDIVQHFSTAFAFIDRCKNKNGKCLIHCNLGVNRSGAVCAGYLMMSEGKTLLQILEHLKGIRSVVLTNRGFRYQLINYARMRNLLDPIISETGLPATIAPPLGNSKFARGACNELKSRKLKGTSDVPPATDFLNINGVKSSKCYYSDPRTGGREKSTRIRDTLPPRPSSACGMVDAPVSSRSFTRSSSAMGVTNRWSGPSWSDADLDNYMDQTPADNPYKFLHEKRPTHSYKRSTTSVGISNGQSYSNPSSPTLSSLFRHKPIYSSTKSIVPAFTHNQTTSFNTPRNILNILSKSRAGSSADSTNGYSSSTASRPSSYQTLTIPSGGGSMWYNLPKPPFGTTRRRFGPSKGYTSSNY